MDLGLLRGVCHDFSNLAIFQGVILKWRSENFGIYKTLTGAQKCARSPIDVSFGLRKGMDKHLKDQCPLFIFSP